MKLSSNMAVGGFGALLVVMVWVFEIVQAFSPNMGSTSSCSRYGRTRPAFSTMADSGVPPSTPQVSSTVADIEIPTSLPSDVGKDYVPLATMLATGDLSDADQVRVRISKGSQTFFSCLLFTWRFIRDICSIFFLYPSNSQFIP